MAHTTDGGPAFPGTYTGNHGMSLRDYFAAKALRAVTSGDHVDGVGDPERHAMMAYLYADAMLTARAVQSPADAQRAHLDEFGK